MAGAKVCTNHGIWYCRSFSPEIWTEQPYTVKIPNICPDSIHTLNHIVISPRVIFGASSVMAIGDTTDRAPIPKPVTIWPTYSAATWLYARQEIRLPAT